MLLDRRKIRRWAKWVALALAIIFALSFLFMGVGYGGAGFNISEIFTSGGCSSDTGSSTATTSVEEELAAYDAALQANPNDIDALLGVANLFDRLYQQGQGSGNQYLLTSAKYLEQIITVDPTQKEIYMRLANIYLSKDVNDDAKAIAVLNKAVQYDPDNPDVYLKLGVAQQGAGNKSAAVMAWQKYLELDPTGDMATTVRQQIEKIAESATSTTSTTSGSSTTTTAGATTTTTGAPTTATTAAQ